MAALEVLWAPWRMAYIESPKDGVCIFCDALEGEPRQKLLLAATADVMVLLNRYPYNNGHLMVAPRRHVGSLAALSVGENAALAEALRRAVDAVSEALKPEGLNVGLNLGRPAGAGVVDHIHWHVVPRWVGDTNFMPVLAEVRVMPQHLLESYERLRPAVVARLSGAPPA